MKHFTDTYIYTLTQKCTFIFYIFTSLLYIAPDSYLQTTQTLLIKLQGVITNGNPGLLSCLPHINATLKKLLYTCNVTCTVESTNMDNSFEGSFYV